MKNFQLASIYCSQWLPFQVQKILAIGLHELSVKTAVVCIVWISAVRHTREKRWLRKGDHLMMKLEFAFQFRKRSYVFFHCMNLV